MLNVFNGMLDGVTINGDIEWAGQQPANGTIFRQPGAQRQPNW